MNKKLKNITGGYDDVAGILRPIRGKALPKIENRKYKKGDVRFYRTDDQNAAVDEFNKWMKKYLPEERKIIREREKRLENKENRLKKERIQFANLCEATEGLAVAWRRDGASIAEMLRYAAGDRLVLATLMPFIKKLETQKITKMRRKLMRPLYYAKENERRRQLAAERRKIRMRTTENPCPTREMILDAWLHVRDGRDAMIRFGSMLEDLECYVDHKLRRVDGVILGREPGIKGWLKDNIPALTLKYSTIMRYKATTKKLRQIVELKDPVPVDALLHAPNDQMGSIALNLPKNSVPSYNGKNTAVDETEISDKRELKGMDVRCDYSAENIFYGSGAEKGMTKPALNSAGSQRNEELQRRNEERRNEEVLPGKEEEREVMILRGRAIMLEALSEVPEIVTKMIRRIDELVDPERIEDATMLKRWREKYSSEIIVRKKSMWWRKLFYSVG